MTNYETAYRALREAVSLAADRAERDLALMGEGRTPGVRNTRAFAEGVVLELRDLVTRFDPSALLAPSPAEGTGEACPECDHIHTPEGCTGPQSPSDIWAGVSVSGCDCDVTPAPVSSSEAAALAYLDRLRRMNPGPELLRSITRVEQEVRNRPGPVVTPSTEGGDEP